MNDKNIPASIRQKLLNLSREQNLDFQLLLTRFILERFLFRLSKSKYKSKFVLKGAMLFQVWEDDIFRPTKDIDLLSFGKPDLDYFEKVVQEICSQSFPEDGISFDIDSVQTSRIKEEDEYQGLRVQLFAFLGSARVRVQIDIGFGDAVTPEPLDINYPTILSLPAPVLKAYSRETSVAEKFHAMINLGIANSRMKDFYDIWILLKSYDFNGAILTKTIFDTFERRKTTINDEVPLVFTDEFYKDKAKESQLEI